MLAKGPFMGRAGCFARKRKLLRGGFVRSKLLNQQVVVFLKRVQFLGVYLL